MEVFRVLCSVCADSVDHQSLDSLSEHYRSCHGNLSEFLCGQDGCVRIFSHKNSMIRHISADHRKPTKKRNVSHAISSAPIKKSICNVVAPGFDDFLEDSVESFPGQSVAQSSIADRIKEQGVQMVLALRASPGMTGNALKRAMDSATTLVQTVSTSVKEKLSHTLQEEGIAPDKIEDILKSLSIDVNPFENLYSTQNQLQYFKKRFGLACPQEKYLGFNRCDQYLDPSTNTYIQVKIPESFQYVSVIDTLQTVLSNNTTRQKMFRKSVSRDGVLRSFADGDFFKTHPFLLPERNVIFILLYYDELEVANALGSKTTIHKLGTFFIQFLNLPSEDLSQLSSIHLLALAYAADMRKKGAFIQTLTPFIQEMKKLSSHEGVKLKIDGQTMNIHALCVGLSADTLAAHDVMGLLSPSAKFFCRQCLITRDELRTDSNMVGERRTSELHAEHVRKVQQEKTFSKQCGVRWESPLHQIPYFDLTQQCFFDAFHDILEGSAPKDIMLVLREFIIVRKLLSVQTFNNNIDYFMYGTPDMKNKPSSNITEEMLKKVTSSKLKQTGSQTWCLLRVLPFLLHEYVPERDKHMELIFLLQDICCIVFSHTLRHSDIEQLESIITKHNELFKELFIDSEHGEGQEATEEEGLTEVNDNVNDRPQVPSLKIHMFNKLHHLKHYGCQIRSFGPLVKFWCAKFEGRLKIFRQYSAVCGNFTKIHQTMANMFQLSSLSNMVDETAARVEYPKGNSITVSQIFNPTIFLEAGIKESDTVICTKSASVNGQEYRVGLFVCTKKKPTGLVFSIIQDVVVCQQNSVFLVVCPWSNNGMSRKLNAYSVVAVDNETPLVINNLSLPYFRPIAPWSPCNSQDVFLSLRTIVV